MATEADVEGSLTVANADRASLTSLPHEARCQPFPLDLRRGFWLPRMVLPGVDASEERFEPRATDVLIASSFPKSGTTWPKALAFATLNRGEHPPSDPGHPLRRRSPHECVKFLELAFALAEEDGRVEDVFRALPSPRVLATHLPYSLLPERLKAEGPGCRIVYICRHPKDTLISGWLSTGANDAGGPSLTLEEAFRMFYDGPWVSGPYWNHVLGYWEESRRRPDKVLFLRYEEMLRDPVGNVNKLAEFMGCAFSSDEKVAGVVDAVVELCNLHSLNGPEPNRSDAMGLAGGNVFTSEMAARLDMIMETKLEGSGLTFRGAAGFA